MKKLFVVAVLMVITIATLNAEVKFMRGPLADALQKAAQEKKPVMIDFITDWCRWCDTLDAQTYSNSSVAGFLNASVVPIKIDAEKGEGIEIAKKYGVNAYPTIILISPNGDEIDRVLGYVPPQPFLETLHDFVNGKNTIGILTAQVKENPNDPILRYALAKKYTDRNEAAPASEEFRKLLELDPGNALGHNEEAQYAVAIGSLRSAKNASALETFIDEHPQSPKLRESLSTLIRFYSKEKNGELTRKYFLRYMENWPTDAAMMNNYAWGCAGRGTDLGYAAEVAEKAVELASSSAEKASYLDTYATVRFAQGKTDEAITLEQQAIDLLKTVPNAKMKPYEESMAKFRAAQNPSPK